jgi:hypothetical protein
MPTMNEVNKNDNQLVLTKQQQGQSWWSCAIPQLVGARSQEEIPKQESSQSLKKILNY